MTTPEEPTPYDNFVSDANKRARLKALLEEPVLKEAMDIAEDLLRPRCGTPADANQALSIAKFHQSAGVNEFLKRLKDLTREQKLVTKLSVKKFATSIDDLPKIEQ
jgi:hypothetical protein